MFHGHLIWRKEPTQCLTCGETLTVKQLFTVKTTRRPEKPKKLQITFLKLLAKFKTIAIKLFYFSNALICKT